MSRARKPTTPKAEESGHETDLGGGGNSSEEHIQVSVARTQNLPSLKAL